MESFKGMCRCGLWVMLLGACTLPLGTVPVEERGHTWPERQRPPAKPIPPVAKQPKVIAPKIIPKPATPPASDLGIKGKPEGSARTPPASSGPAVVALLNRAKSLANSGEGEQAAAMLERALRIEPRNPWLWHRLAVLRLQQGEWRQALELATKSNTLSNDYPRLLMGNWKVISMALERLGDGDGAREAQAKSEEYRQEALPDPP
jgi:tetratricopeptide (TPR) repeat protein